MTIDGRDDDSRLALDHAARSRGVDYASLSRLIGRNAAYIQQYIKRGTPRTLPERERALIADFLMMDERLLGAPAPRSSINARTNLVPVSRLDVGAAAGAGGVVEDDLAIDQLGFDERWLRKLSPNLQALAIIRVEGDSMHPTLNHGDDIMVDSSDCIERLRDGIYVLRRDGALLVKRLSRAVSGPVRGMNIISDNAAYPTEYDADINGVTIVGRVVWVGRRVI
ncbi:MAG: S24 family peptidase [Sphingopyxis sp.]